MKKPIRDYKPKTYVASAFNHKTQKSFIIRFEAQGLREARYKAFHPDPDVTVFSSSVVTEKDYQKYLKDKEFDKQIEREIAQKKHRY